jgi:hypothetical protein
MTAPTRPDFASLDRRITQALTALRLVRGDSTQARTREGIAAEKRAEADLNALLDYRQAAQRQ